MILRLKKNVQSTFFYLPKNKEFMTIEVTIGLLAAAFGMFEGYLGFQRNRDTDV
ncbi:hypothetical protein [Sporosarcina sp. E16_8]|uniref:hypothetical protein n=1 Tax=Sporosarcina sp. E16_8 TaxID=2789295 RepID=UPI001A936CD2|nr:hypothetical protein [Sporosarcina sp. E16_8]MBO0588001.1 hypothetical protein [Sporosarcina sp. E16_8]